MYKLLREYTDLANRYGFSVEVTRGGHFKFSRDGCQTVFAPKTPGDWRNSRVIETKLGRSARGVMVRRGQGQSSDV